MENWISLCIWGDGPGRPYDNVYLLKNIDYCNNIIHLFFQDGEECIIKNPKGVSFSKKGIKIETAEKIIWSFYLYGKPKTQDTFVTIEYAIFNDDFIQILENGFLNTTRIIPKEALAFDSFGDIDLN